MADGNIGDLHVMLHFLTWKNQAPAKDIKTGSRKPSDGTCKRCGERRPLNRLKLCYRCWVHCEIEQREGLIGRYWHPGDPHPDWCQCTLAEHPRRSSGN